MKVNIFTPTYHRFEMTKRCLESVIPLVYSSQFEVKLFICDNNSDEEMVEWIKTLSGDKVGVFLSDKNIGKASIVNQVYRDQGSDCDYVISMDSDLIFKDVGYNFIDEMVIAAHMNQEFGLLSTFQDNNNQHLWEGLQEIKNTKNHSIAYGKFNSIAGGCIILSKLVWDAVKGYSTYGNVYGFDDGLLMQSVHFLGKRVGVVSNIKLFHPDDENKEYREWKRTNIAQRKSEGFFES